MYHSRVPAPFICQPFMKGNPQPSELSDLTKLLLNSWSAEYALRIQPLLPENPTDTTPETWIFPQAYYTGLFSLQATLLVMGELDSKNEQWLKRRVSAMYEDEFYPDRFVSDEPGTTWFEALEYLRVTTNRRLTVPSVDVTEFHSVLVTAVDKLLAYHEEFICERVGVVNYLRVLSAMPGYITEPMRRFNNFNSTSFDQLFL